MIDILKFKAVLGIRIRQFREKLGLSQEEAAERCGLEVFVYREIERGVRNIDILLFEKVVMGLDMTYDDFVRPESS